MKYHHDLGITLSRTLAYGGARITEMGGVLFAAAHHGLDMPLQDYELREAEKSAREVLEAIASYRDATAPKADPVITWPRPSYHRQAEGRRCDDIPDDAA